ncbi:hypothetical protein FACS1894170_04940 [Planctomycetales bacterium]|nr:hypothetical protein FACS1894170_04940 [Planctomycetales bacterium]
MLGGKEMRSDLLPLRISLLLTIHIYVVIFGNGGKTYCEALTDCLEFPFAAVSVLPGNEMFVDTQFGF